MTLQEKMDRSVIESSLERLFCGEDCSGYAVIVGEATADHVMIWRTSESGADVPTVKYLFTGRPYRWARVNGHYVAFALHRKVA